MTASQDNSEACSCFFQSGLNVSKRKYLRRDLHEDISDIQNRQQGREVLSCEVQVGLQPSKTCSTGETVSSSMSMSSMISLNSPCIVAIDLQRFTIRISDNYAARTNLVLT